MNRTRLISGGAEPLRGSSPGLVHAPGPVHERTGEQRTLTMTGTLRGSGAFVGGLRPG
jgi:hypothetical protein